jgi:hypothetical protein
LNFEDYASRFRQLVKQVRPVVVTRLVAELLTSLNPQSCNVWIIQLENTYPDHQCSGYMEKNETFVCSFKALHPQVAYLELSCE